MEKLTSSSSSSSKLGAGGVKLTGTVEADEFYIKAGLKGRSYHLEILNSGRSPRRRRLKPFVGNASTFYTLRRSKFTVTYTLDGTAK